jgi:hypothetical protein
MHAEVKVEQQRIAHRHGERRFADAGLPEQHEHRVLNVDGIGAFRDFHDATFSADSLRGRGAVSFIVDRGADTCAQRQS